MLDFIPLGNSIDVFIKNLHAASNPGTPLTDATMTFSIYDPNNAVVAGADAVSMTHRGSGEYRGTAASLSLTAGAWYKIVVTCSNYASKWTRTFVAQTRPFKV